MLKLLAMLARAVAKRTLGAERSARTTRRDFLRGIVCGAVPPLERDRGAPHPGEGDLERAPGEENGR